MGYGDFNRRTDSEKTLHDKALLKIRNVMDQSGYASINFLIKKTDGAIKNENMSNCQTKS